MPMRSSIETADAVRRGELKATEVLDECLAAIDAGNASINAFVHLDADLAHESAARVDQTVAEGGDPGPFAGLPIGVKDLEDCAGMPTSHGSLLFQGRPPVEVDSIHVARLRAAGAVPVGKTAAPEFGTPAFTSTRAWGTTRNPWNLTRTPGGSSGGSAAAVSAGLVPLCTGSDGGGSVRIPAAFCGLVGLKPSYGRIPNEDNQPAQTSTYGALVTTIADAARHLDVVAGPDDRDRTSLPPPGVTYESVIETLAVKGLRAAWSSDLGFAVVDPEVEGLAQQAALALIDAAGLVPVDKPVQLTDPAKLWWNNGVLDLWTHLERGMWPERADELEYYNRGSAHRSEVATAPKIARIWMARRRLQFEVAAYFSDVDVLLTPSTAVGAFAAEGPMPDQVNGVEVAPPMAVPFTMLANLSWAPAISVPAGTTSDGLPVGLQIIGRRFADDVVLRLARLFEMARPWPRWAPDPHPVGPPASAGGPT
jgi:aspartyl-tRNA(Asn)/glutamyl-tRNA(Gln) amidotransferase subunit A